jgi:asparagine synthase (glutamine-hydrolysing)
MSGVFAVADCRRTIADLRGLTDRMSAAMCHREWFVAERFVDNEHQVALGRIGIGIFNRSPQPAWNARRTVAVVMAGELSAPDAPGTGEPGAGEPGERVVLALYDRLGDAFVHHLRGVFIVGLWDAERRRLVIANDRFGLYPLFYSWRAGRLLCAPEMKGLLCDDSFPRKLDLTALSQYVRFQHLLGERTFFEGMALLPSASLLVCDLAAASCTVRAYWTFDEIPHRPQVRFSEAVEETGLLLRRAVRRLSGDGYRPGVYLSGGLDSRTILGLVERRPIVSITYGTRNCRDVHYAGRIARRVGSRHYWFDLPDGRWVREQVGLHLELTEGLHSWIHAHGMTTLAEARRLMDVNLTGWDGGTVMGHRESIEPLQIAAVDDAALVARVFHLFNQEYTWPSLTEAEEALLYAEPLRRELRGRAFDSFRDEVTRYLAYRPDVRSEYFYLRNHCGRFTHNLVTFTRSHLEVRFPFFDYDLMDFLYSLPALVRGHQVLYRAVIQRETPRLAYIPCNHEERLPTTHVWIRSAHALTRQLTHRLQRHAPGLFAGLHTLYADYERYARNELRDWVEGILFDRRTRERGLFDPAFLRALMERHLSGREEWTIGKIAPIVTYEMMLRRLHD